MSSDGTYAPKSPDLSSFYSPGPTKLQGQGQSSPDQFFAGQPPPQPSLYQVPPVQYANQLLSSQGQQHLHQQQHPLHPSSYYPLPTAPPTRASPTTRSQPQLPHQPNHNSPQATSRPAQPSRFQSHPLAQPSHHPSFGPSFTSHPQHPQHYSPPGHPPPAQQPHPQHLPVHSQADHGFQPQPTLGYQDFYQQPYGDLQYPQLQFPPQSQPFPQQPPFLTSPAPPPPPPQAQPQSQPQPPSSPPLAGENTSPAEQDPQPQPQPQPTSSMPPRRSAAQAAQQQAAITSSPVKTKFPTARIKRIMQADEEVGKVAQQTPIAVGKALEMFMVALVTKSADVAKEKNSKRVTAQMLKHVVESDDQWDFLRDIVSRVDNEDKAGKAGKGKAAESESEEEVVVEKKKGRPGRKKKA